MSHAAVSRWENGHRHPRPEDVASILTALGVGGDEREQLLDLARQPDQRQWLSIGMTEQQRQLAALLEYEAQASAITAVSPLLIPGMLQTAGYARSVMRAAQVPAEEVETRVHVRLGRRDALTRPDPVHLTAVIGEGALQQQTDGGPAVMLEQLRHLLRVAEMPTVNIQVLPTRCPWNPALEGPFIIIEFAGADPVVHLENRRSGLFLHEVDDVDAYRTAVELVLRAAMSTEESVALIAREAEMIGAING